MYFKVISKEEIQIKFKIFCPNNFNRNNFLLKLVLNGLQILKSKQKP